MANVLHRLLDKANRFKLFDSEDLFVSIHIPKCAGTSMKKLLSQRLGNNVKFDYGDKINCYSDQAIALRERRQLATEKSLAENNGSIKLIHGHFYARKYLSLRDKVKWITVMRDPMDLLPSYYYYLTKKDKGELPNLVRDLGSLDAFIEHGWFQNIMSRQVEGLAIGDFEYVGSLENSEEAFSTICSLLKIKYRPVWANLGKENAQKSGKLKYSLTESQRQKIEKLNTRDFELFSNAREQFQWN